MAKNDVMQQTDIELKIFDSVKSDVDIVVDIGCRENYEYALLKPEAKMYLFDMSQFFIDKLNEKLKDKNFNIETFCFGVSNRNEVVQFDEDIETIQPHRFRGNSLSTAEIKKFDEVIDECNIGQIDFLKIDVEGSEPEILEYVDIIKNIKYVQFEFGSGWPNLSQNNVWDIIQKYKDTHDSFYLKDVRHSCVRNSEETFPLLTPITEEFHNELHKHLMKNHPEGEGGNVLMIKKDAKFNYKMINRGGSKVYDVFLFNNELDLLEIRLNLLNEYVDHFVISESRQTHSGLEKELYYQNNKHLFKKFEHKIIHNVIDQPTQEDLNIVSNLYSIHNYRTFQQDAYEKDSIKKVLEKYCSEDDIIIWSDLDEVPNPQVIKELDTFYDSDQVYNFAQDNFQGFLNWIETTGTITSQTSDFQHEGNSKWIGTKMFSFATLKKYTMTQMRRELPNESNVRIYPGGWHWSTVGSPNKLSYYERVLGKIKGSSHTELDTEDLISSLPKRIEENKSPLGQDNASYAIIELTEANNFPKYLIDNIEKYSYLVKQ